MDEQKNNVDGGTITDAGSLARAQLARATPAELARAFETRSLSPADLNLLLNLPEVKVLACAALIRALGATKYYYDKEAKGMVHVDDYATQLAAAKLIYERVEGLPVQTNLNLNANTSAKKADIDPENMTPAAAEALVRLADRVKKANERKGAIDMQSQ